MGLDFRDVLKIALEEESQEKRREKLRIFAEKVEKLLRCPYHTYFVDGCIYCYDVLKLRQELALLLIGSDVINT